MNLLKNMPDKQTYLLLSRTIIACMPVEESSRVLMKKSLMSDIKFVKQKKQSASA